MDINREDPEKIYDVIERKVTCGCWKKPIQNNLSATVLVIVNHRISSLFFKTVLKISAHEFGIQLALNQCTCFCAKNI